jgi:hypothetical protein
VLTFIKGKELIKLASDENKVVSDFYTAVKKAITKIEYNISTKEAEAFKKEKYDEVCFEINGNEILFSVLKS